jgi:hypothetical protein
VQNLKTLLLEAIQGVLDLFSRLRLDTSLLTSISDKLTCVCKQQGQSKAKQSKEKAKQTTNTYDNSFFHEELPWVGFEPTTQGKPQTTVHSWNNVSDFT